MMDLSRRPSDLYSQFSTRWIWEVSKFKCEIGLLVVREFRELMGGGVDVNHLIQRYLTASGGKI